MYIEQASYDPSRKHRVRVGYIGRHGADDYFGHAAERISATELHWEVEQANEHIEAILEKLKEKIGLI